jgi:predicted transcriptional regulator
MGNLIRPTQVHLVTKEGECQLNITIDLNINLNNGTVDFQSSRANKIEKIDEENDDDKTVWAIPTFKSEDKVKFGKRKEQE